MIYSYEGGEIGWYL